MTTAGKNVYFNVLDDIVDIQQYLAQFNKNET